MGPVTPPVDSRAPVCARLDRARVRVYRDPRGFCAIRPRACDLCACVPRCASVCVCARMRALHLCANSASVRVVVACIDGVDMQAGCVDHSLTGHEPEPKQNTEQLAHENYTFEHRPKREND